MQALQNAKIFLLLPLSGFYGLVVWIRRYCYQIGLKKTTKSAVPVIVVGNISIGGSGKTPLTLALINHFQDKNLVVAVVSRGYGGSHNKGNLWVNQTPNATIAGDEPVLLANSSNAIVVVNKNRPDAITFAITKGAQVIISDDGLQHYAMARDIEIAVIDNIRGIGNGLLLPSGILREPISRLNGVDFIVEHKRLGGRTNTNQKLQTLIAQNNAYNMQLTPTHFVNVLTNKTISIEQLLEKYKPYTVHAIAGIAFPESFFSQLRQLGFNPIVKSFSDHYAFSQQDFDLISAHPILMTQKDSVKCRVFADENMWYLAIKAELSTNFFTDIDLKLSKKLC